MKNPDLGADCGIRTKLNLGYLITAAFQYHILDCSMHAYLNE